MKFHFVVSLSSPMVMQIKFIFTVLFIFLTGNFTGQNSSNRDVFYEAMMGKDLKAINGELNKLEGKEAFKGALLMKKAGLLTEPKDRLKTFKEGRAGLESAISKDSTNSEYRFLRILIQENAPKIVHYTSEIKKDALYLRTNYKSLPLTAKKALNDYSKTSKELKPEDFKK